MHILREVDTSARADVWTLPRSAMPVSRTNFCAGDRVRGADWFDEIAGAVGTVVVVDLRVDTLQNIITICDNYGTMFMIIIPRISGQI